MKKILIPTDFSISAKNAVDYAMHLAKHMKANIILCNVIAVPLEIPLAGQVAAPIVSFEKLEYDVEQDLQRAAADLTEKERFEAPSDTFHPLVEYVVRVGNVPEVIAAFAAGPHVILTVMGMSGAGGLGKFLLGSNSRAMVEHTKTPLLLIPQQSRFTGLRKIAFSTDLSKTDSALIYTLADFARYFNAEILLVHISEQAPEHQSDIRLKIDSLLNEVTSKVNYHKIYYQHVLDATVDKGLNWLAEYGQIQMVVLVHRKHHVLDQLFHGSYTQKLKKRIKIPLFVFPAEYQSELSAPIANPKLM